MQTLIYRVHNEEHEFNDKKDDNLPVSLSFFKRAMLLHIRMLSLHIRHPTVVLHLPLLQLLDLPLSVCIVFYCLFVMNQCLAGFFPRHFPLH